MKKPTVKHITGYLESLEIGLRQRGKTPFLSLSSIPSLNAKIWGIKKKKLTLIGARTSQGKSSMALQIAYDLASQGHPVLFLSLEMDVEDLMERLFCNVRGIDNFELQKGYFENYISEYLEFSSHCKDINLTITDFMGRTWEEIDIFLRELSVKPEVIILDYIQTIKTVALRSKEVMDEYIRHFREMAIRNDFAAIICSQVNRTSQESDDKEPQLHQLKGTGYLEEHSDIIILLHWPYFYDANKPKEEYKLIIAKNRNGATGYLKLLYRPEYYRFEDWSDLEERVKKHKEQQKWEEEK